MNEEDTLYKELENTGLDMHAAFEYMADMDTLKICLVQFDKDFDETLGRLRETLSKGDLNNFAICIHGLKGAFAALGNEPLSVMAKALETAAKAGERQFCEEEMPRTLEAFTSFRDKLRATSLFREGMETRRPNRPVMEADRSRLRRELEALYTAAYNAQIDPVNEAMQILDSLRLSEESPEISALWEECRRELHGLLEQFDYTRAADKVQRLLQALR